MPVQARRTTVGKPKETNPEKWTGTILNLKGIGHGVSGMVLIIDGKRVIKVGFTTIQGKEDAKTERRAYKIIEQTPRSSPHILQCLELDNPQGLIFERCVETVRARLSSMPDDALLCDRDARTWAKQAAEGLAFLHDHNIIHADVGCHNMLLDSANLLKLCDFAGSSVEGSPSSTNYEVWSRLPSKRPNEPTMDSEQFALGSSLYEMSTKNLPYFGKPRAEVQRLFQRGQFPTLKKIGSLGNIIAKCWSLKYSLMSEVVHEIDPSSSLCCPAPMESIKKNAPMAALALRSPVNTGKTATVSHPTISHTTTSITKPPFSWTRYPLSSLSVPWPFESPSLSQSGQQMVPTSPAKASSGSSTAKDNQEQQHEVDIKGSNKTTTNSEKTNNRENKRSTRRRSRHPSLLLWMNKSRQAK